MLRGAGLRVTRPRLAVLSVVHAQPHADTDSIITAVRKEFGRVSHQAVYDVLHALTRRWSGAALRAVRLVARYETRVRDNHHHLVCRSCGAIADVDGAVGVTACLTAPDASGYDIGEAEVIYWGRCPECVAASTSGG